MKCLGELWSILRRKLIPLVNFIFRYCKNDAKVVRKVRFILQSVCISCFGKNKSDSKNAFDRHSGIAHWKPFYVASMLMLVVFPRLRWLAGKNPCLFTTAAYLSRGSLGIGSIFTFWRYESTTIGKWPFRRAAEAKSI